MQKYRINRIDTKNSLLLMF